MRARTRALWCRCCTLLCCRSLTFFRVGPPSEAGVGALSEVASKSDAFRTRRLALCTCCPVSKEDTRGQHHSAQTLYVVQPGQTGVRHTPWPSPSTAMRPGALEKAIASISRYSRTA